MFKTTDVTAIGNAIVDVVTTADEGFLTDHGIDKGVMTLINAEQLQSLLPKTHDAKIISGGSAANTIVGFSMLGGSGAYIGKVKNDTAGNAWEWNEDCWHKSYSGAPIDSRAWTAGGRCNQRIVRGGSWISIARYVRSGNRSKINKDSRIYRNGFRVALTLGR